ncbi:MAG: type III pantothenate kinase [Clostridia bacterium]|nr:type III pantothenate kinase [Clostridia bacterium]
MILAIDIGNTNIVIGKYQGDSLEYVARIMTDAHKSESEYAVTIQNILSLDKNTDGNIEGAIISSVVPPLTKTIQYAIKMLYGVDAYIVGPGIKTGIHLQVDNPAQVGADLICACVAAYNKYDSPALVIDMGTATKIMVVDENAVFVGVSIAPGVELSLKALSGGTAQLPQISLDAPSRVIAKNTVECMKSGVIFGNASMLDGMIERIEEELGKKPTLIATGGYANAVVPHCKHDITIDNNLLLDGLIIMYNKNRRN